MNFLATLRYLVFAAFIICNAVLASVAVWNSSLVSPLDRDSRIDTYLIVVGALGLALTFTIIFAELVRRNAFTSRVWFEILWTSVFFILDLVGAILTAVGPDTLCRNQRKNSQLLPPGSCSSTRVLMGFTWVCTIILLIYLVLLSLLTIINRNNQSVPRIWECTVHNLPPIGSQNSNANILPGFTKDRMAEVVSPVPQRPTTVPSALYSLRSAGLGSQYQIEHFKPPAHTPVPPAPLHRSPSTAGNVQAAVTLYPQFISSAYVPRPSTSVNVPPPPPVPTPLTLTSPSPPPLGDWPRADAPLRVKRKLPPTGERQAGGPVSRPMGPRTRTGGSSISRPPALDLSFTPSTRRDREHQS